MEAIILAGGFGTRLREVVPDLPKPMAPVAGRPFLEILLTALARKGFGRITLSLGFMADKIERHFGSRFADIELAYVVEDKPLGTGGAIRLAMQNCLADHVYIFNGDTFLDLEASDIEHLWQKRGAPIIVGRKVPDTGRYGRLLVSGGKILGFSEKGMDGEGLINAGCYVLNRQQLDMFPANQPFSFENEYLADHAQSQRFDVFITQGHFIDIGVPEDYARAQTELSVFS